MAAVEEKTGLALVLQNLMIYRTVKVRGAAKAAEGCVQSAASRSMRVERLGSPGAPRTAPEAPPHADGSDTRPEADHCAPGAWQSLAAAVHLAWSLAATCLYWSARAPSRSRTGLHCAELPVCAVLHHPGPRVYGNRSGAFCCLCCLPPSRSHVRAAGPDGTEQRWGV